MAGLRAEVHRGSGKPELSLIMESSPGHPGPWPGYETPPDDARRRPLTPSYVCCSEEGRRPLSMRVADESACTPDSVPTDVGGGHPSRHAVAGGLLRPTRRLGRAVLERLRRSVLPLGLAPGGVYLATPVTRGAGELLPHRFTLTPVLADRGGLFSVALSRGSPRVAVSNHPALRSPDFPRAGSPRLATALPARPQAGW